LKYLEVNTKNISKSIIKNNIIATVRLDIDELVNTLAKFDQYFPLEIKNITEYSDKNQIRLFVEAHQSNINNKSDEEHEQILNIKQYNEVNNKIEDNI